jgi:hypothetical protein
MTKQPTRGHISIKGPTYWAFREACKDANVTMGRLLDKLIMAELDQISFTVDEPKPTLGVTTPEQLLAVFHHTFSIPAPLTSYCCIGEEGTGTGDESDLEKYPTEDEAFARVDPYHVEVTRKEPPEMIDLRIERLETENYDYRVPQETGLFSEEGIKQALAEPKAASAPRKAEGTKPPAFHEIKSCIDPTWSKKR